MNKHNYDKNDIDIIIEAYKGIINENLYNNDRYLQRFLDEKKKAFSQEMPGEDAKIFHIFVDLAKEIFCDDAFDDLWHDLFLDTVNDYIESNAEYHTDYEKYEGITWPRVEHYFTIDDMTADDDEIKMGIDQIWECFNDGDFDEIFKRYIPQADPSANRTLMSKFVNSPYVKKCIADKFESLYEQELEDWEPQGW